MVQTLFPLWQHFIFCCVWCSTAALGSYSTALLHTNSPLPLQKLWCFSFTHHHAASGYSLQFPCNIGSKSWATTKLLDYPSSALVHIIQSKISKWKLNCIKDKTIRSPIPHSWSATCMLDRDVTNWRYVRNVMVGCCWWEPIYFLLCSILTSKLWWIIAPFLLVESTYSTSIFSVTLKDLMNVVSVRCQNRGTLNFLRPTTDLFMCTVPSFRVSAPRIFPGLMPTLTLPIAPRCRNMGTLSRPCQYCADSLLQLLTGSLRILRMLPATTAHQSIVYNYGRWLDWTKWWWYIRTHLLTPLIL